MTNRGYLWFVLMLIQMPVLAIQCEQPLPNYLTNKPYLNESIEGITLAEIQQQAATQGVFQFVLGGVYEHGLLGVDVDYAESFAWYTKAATQNILAAQHQLGLLNLFCQGGKTEDAIYWFFRSNKKQLQPENMLYIAFAMAHFSTSEQERADGIVNLKKLADKKYKPAIYEYAAMLWSGDKVTQDKSSACQLMQTIQLQDYRRAFYDLALCHRDGIGVTKDINQYKQLINQSAKFGDIRAINLLKRIKE